MTYLDCDGSHEANFITMAMYLRDRQIWKLRVIVRGTAIRGNDSSCRKMNDVS